MKRKSVEGVKWARKMTTARNDSQTRGTGAQKTLTTAEGIAGNCGLYLVVMTIKPTKHRERKQFCYSDKTFIVLIENITIKLF